MFWGRSVKRTHGVRGGGGWELIVMNFIGYWW